MKKNAQVSLVKHVEVFDGEKWKPIIWYSNRSDNQFDSLFDGPQMIEHGNIFNNSFEEFSRLVENTDLQKRGLPEDMSEYVKDKISKMPGTFYGASFYYINELKGLISKEEALLVGELKNGVEIKLFDNMENVKKLLEGTKLDYVEDNEMSGDTCVRVIRIMAKTVDQLKYIANIVTKLVYEVHGFVEDDKIRVIFYYRA